jgi:hypothetical protein
MRRYCGLTNRSSRKIEPHREAGDVAVVLGNLAEDARVVAEQRLSKLSRRRFDRVRETLVLGKRSDQFDDRGLVSRSRRPDFDRQTATSALMWGCGS